MTTLKDRLQTALDAKEGASKAGLAKACNISKASVTNWFNGRTVSLDGNNLIRAAAYLGVSPDWIATGKGQQDRPQAQKEKQPGYQLDGLSVWDDRTPLDSDDVEIPLFKEVELAAGDGHAHQVEINGRKLRFSKATLKAAGVDIANAACATVSGNSMERRISDGATIGIDMSRTQIRDGEIYAIDHDGMLRVKYLYRVPGGIRLRSENSEEHPDEIYTGEAASRIRVLGWVFWWSILRRWGGSKLD